MILLAGQLSFGILESYPKTLLAIATAILAELILGKIFTGKFPHLASAYISGISVGILVRSPDYWPYALCSLITITSKYVIRWKGRHLWNPSNFGICMLLLLAPYKFTTLSIQWGNSLWPMIVVWVLGAFIVYRLQRLHITLTYVASFFLFSYLRSTITHDNFWAELAPITGPMYQLFIFFMITDPKTTVLTKKGQILVAFLVAAMECVLRLLHFLVGSKAVDDFSVHAPYYALFIVGPLANILEIWQNSRKQPAPPAVPQSAG
jgi:Na+-translocating ferredoxin:NAD+ oxidoreductase RnfD subunit